MFSKQELLVFGLIIIAIAFSCIVSIFLGWQVGIGGLLLIIISFITARFPRTSLYIFLVYLCFGGTITYLIPGMYEKVGPAIKFSRIYPVFQFVKDVFYLPVIISILINNRQTLKELLSRIKPLWWAILAFTGVCLLTILFVNLPQQFNPNSGQKLEVLMGIIGLKIWLSYIPLILCGFYLIRNRQDLLKLTRLQIILITICCVLGLIQYFALISGFCNGSVGLPDPTRYRTSLQARCLFGGSLLYLPKANLIRLPGTFVAPWQWGWFLISSIFFAVATAQSESDKKWRYLSWIASFLVLVNAIISGQRIAFLLVPIFFLILFIITSYRTKNFSFKIGIITFLMVISFSLPVVRLALDSFIRRWNYSNPFQFIISSFNYVNKAQNGLFGNGLGTTASAARKLGDIKLVEIFHGQLIYEMGFLGLITFIIMVSILVFLGWRIYTSIQDKSLKNMALCFWIFLLFISYNVYYYPLNVDPVNVYFWLIAGILFRLPDLDTEVKKEEIITENKL
jgi:hypothetical protein